MTPARVTGWANSWLGRRPDKMPHSFIGWLNFLVLQWIGLRIVRILDNDSGKLIGLGWIWPVAPITGWWSDYWPPNPSIRRLDKTS
jgi:hypothetical protein